MNKDFVTGLVGAVVLVAAMVGVFFYERNVAMASGLGEDGAGDLETVTFALAQATGSADVGGSSSATIEITNESVTNVTFTLTWTAANGQSFLQLTAAPAGGNATVSEEESDGEITLRIPTPTGARGTWQIGVDFVRADSGLPGGVAPPGSTDASASWTLATTLEMTRARS